MQPVQAKKLWIRLRCLLRMNSSGLANALEGEKCVLSELAQISELRSRTNASQLVTPYLLVQETLLLLLCPWLRGCMTRC